MALAVCALWGLRLTTAPRDPEPPPAPSCSPRPERTLAFLGDGQDPWCAPLLDGLRPWAGDRGWRLVTYDCAGSILTQRGQLDDLLRVEAPAAAVLYDMGDGDWQNEAAETLEAAGVRTVTLSRRGPAKVGPAPGQPWAAAASAYPGDGQMLLLTDLPDDPDLSAVQAALGDRLAGHGACWATPAYAADYLKQALALCPQTTGVLALTRAGALGAKAFLAEQGLGGVKVICLDPSRETAADLALGRIDALVEVSQDGVLDALALALEGKTPEPLEVTIQTAS